MNKNNNMNVDPDFLAKKIISSSGGKIDANAVKRAKAGDVSGLMSSLSAEDRAKLKTALSDKAAAQKILNSEAAKQLLSSLLKDGNKNG